MAQSVELILDPVSEALIVDEWRVLAAAGLPSSQRSQPDGNHRPHITLYAADAIPAEADQALPGLLTGLDLSVVIGALMVFGPRRGRCVLVRQVVPSRPLLELQHQVAELCQVDPRGTFGPGRWSPHVTLAPRMTNEQVGTALTVVGEGQIHEPARVQQCRRWDGERRIAWWLTG